jgi:hypothetical protein
MDRNQHRGKAALGRPGGNFVVVEAKPEEEDPDYSRYAQDRGLSNLHQPVPQTSDALPYDDNDDLAQRARAIVQKFSLEYEFDDEGIH